ncbi:TRAP transporter large permease [Alteribacter natronophilus]|uniref:TRAP transporter large permease n=1 Tax=Alteribacter natronophilus TaxID=2583810 RepID=UPI00110DC703|nr:TRAP transporter large permease [Alteribacter natronophilus]TMW72316.1 TRAP transporter large permease [Alteribacter natronophilus]
MSPEMIGIAGIAALFILILLKVPVAISLLLVGLVGYAWIRNWNVGLTQLGTGTFDTASSYSLSVIPLFILMGMILSYSGMGRDLYRAVDTWIGHIRGGLAIATIGTSAIFSAISGSVNATTATMAKITLPEMEKYKYHPSLSTACVAAGGTLGILVPPSVILILYGILTSEPIGELLIAGIVPGIIQMLIFIVTIYFLVKRNPELAPAGTMKSSVKEKTSSLLSVMPFFLLFSISIGGIYFGIFTATEAAAVGAFGSLIFAVLFKGISRKKLMASIDETVRLTAMIFLILIGATIFSQFLSISRIPVGVTNYVSGMDVNPYIILILILLVFLLLGLFIEGISILILTIPIVYPLVIGLGFDGVWFGVIMVMVINIGLLTPPLGVSIFVIKGVAKNIPIQTIFRGVTPMVIAMALCTAILIAFPQLVTFLPGYMRN